MDEKKPLDLGNTPITGNYNLTAQLPNGRSIQVSGYLYAGEDVESVNARLDLVQEAIERQRTRCEIPELEARKEQQIAHLKGLREALADLEEKQRSGHLTSQDKMNLKNHNTNVSRLSEEIEKGALVIAESKRKAGVAG